MAILWLWVRIAAVVVALVALLAIVWGASVAPPKPSPSILDTRAAPAVVATPRPPDNEDD
jgi:hypothetical protein